MRNPRYLSVAAILLAAALPALAKPNFSGDWKLNSSKSEFGQMPAPNSMSSKVSHDDPKLKVAIKISTDNGDFDNEANYTTDGKECTNQMFNSEFKSTLTWEGDTLVISSKGKFGDNDFTMVDKWTLSQDGKTLTMNRHFSSGMGEGDQKLTMEKQ